jgi:site-specific DNA-methyltransferase (adenine-specific)
MKPYYEDGSVTLYCADCRDVLPLLARGADLLLTDPPYGVAYESNQRASGWGPILGDGDASWVPDALRAALRVLRVNRHVYVFGPLDLTALTVGGTTELVWDKGKPSSGDLTSPWGPSHERIAFGVWNPYPSQAENGRLSARLRRGTVLAHPKISNGRGARHHPTEKPVALLRDLIESSSCRGETVLDPFAGSGSTGVAAVMEGRRATLIEVEERYCEVAADRLRKVQPALALFQEAAG